MIRQGKGNKARMIPLNASARQTLAEYLDPRLSCDPTMKVVARAFPDHPSGCLSTPLRQSQKKGTLTTSVMRQMIDAAARGLVPTQKSAHILRHTFARNYLAEHPGDIVGACQPPGTYLP
ncbi:tyrosine-type recombinase/integrase [Thermosporothrix hazakensis]|uniref:tyrosine-type recombinase/integrase n=1 Tax=Thermosporothrix hazakensis TaxID=644383 RepID=UPI002011A547|nr:tyrosine-type recombinase/integrase [Thermosporothrix hazakensis]